ncbi:MAG: glycosyltransferase family 2 protein [Candidatus Komeilibacteria bacterium]|nr:glycosyltransferase family 2 protein [Candidatus Komeilibacteria bacterium]
MDISIVIPAYNEEKDIRATLLSVSEYVRNNFSSSEIIVVDDASTDHTPDIVTSMPGVRLIRYAPNRGKGFAVKTGMLAASGDRVLFMDADNSTNIRELDHFIPEIRSHDIVIGSRAVPGAVIDLHQPLYKRWLGRLGNFIIRSVLSLSIYDTQCGFKLFRKETLFLFQKQRLERWGFDFEILFLAKRSGFRIMESQVTWTNNFDTKVTLGGYISVLRDVCMVRLWALLHRY